MKNLSSKLKASRFTPLKIGFITSFIFHSILFTMLIIDFDNSTKEQSMKSQAINISLANISGKNIDSQLKHIKKHNHHRKHHHKSLQAKKAIPTIIVENIDENIENIIKSEMSEDANNANGTIDSTLGASVNLGDVVEILGSDNALYATILDIINNNRNYPKMAIIRKLKDRIQVEFILHKNGEVKAIKVLKGKYQILNDNAIDTIERVSNKFPKPEQSKIIRLTLVYDLT